MITHLRDKIMYQSFMLINDMIKIIYMSIRRQSLFYRLKFCEIQLDSNKKF